MGDVDNIRDRNRRERNRREKFGKRRKRVNSDREGKEEGLNFRENETERY